MAEAMVDTVKSSAAVPVTLASALVVTRVEVLVSRMLSGGSVLDVEVGRTLSLTIEFVVVTSRVVESVVESCCETKLLTVSDIDSVLCSDVVVS